MKIKFLIIPLSICLILGGIFCFLNACFDYKSASNINAVVTKCDHELKTDSDGVPQDVYKIYVRYTFNNIEYSDVYLKTQNKQIEIGETVPIKVSPNNPAEPFEYTPIVLIITGIVMMLFGSTSLVSFLKK